MKSKIRELPAGLAIITQTVAIALTIYHLYAAGISPVTAIYHRSIHLVAILALTFILHPPFRTTDSRRGRLASALDAILVFAGLTAGAYIWLNYESVILRQGDWTIPDIIMGVITVLLVLEACRRVVGLFMPLIAVAFLIYAYFGPYMPSLIAHKGYSVERIASILYLTTEGIWGLPIGVASTFVFVFIVFGVFLEKSGGGAFFIDMAYSATGRMVAGPAKTAVIASGLMGSFSGSAVANVVTTGSFTIPMMKKVGYRPHVAGAIEAAASTGGQIMPPIMGAGAFLMAEFTNTSYLTIIKVAALPALLYYFSIFCFVHIKARKENFAVAADEIPKLRTILRQGWHFLIPVLVLVMALISHFSPMKTGFLAVISTMAVVMINRRSRMTMGTFLSTLAACSKSAIMVSVACACAGIIVGCVNLTGLGLKFSSLVVSLADGNVLLALLLIAGASLILGMGLPVTASYIVLAILAGPSLVNMGLPILTAHMIVFWYSQDANVTPPVSLAAFAGASIAGASPMRTGFASWKIAKGLYLIPIVMAYRPLLGDGPALEVAATVLFTALGLLSFTAVMDRYLTRALSKTEASLLALVTLLLFWPNYALSAFGAALFLALILYGRLRQR